MIVVVATEDDLTAQAVVVALAKLGRKDVFCLDLETAFENVSVHFSADATGIRWSIQSKSDASLRIDQQNISAVYWRRPLKLLGSPFLGIPTSGNLDALETFWSVRWMLETLPRMLFPLNHPLILSRSENKHRQLALALEVGFTIPDTCHSNDAATLQEFVARQTSVALKAMRMPAVSSAGGVEDARHIACKSFSPEFLAARLQAVEKTQLYCQQAIQRSKDLRIMVFPHQVIAVEIDTSKLADNKLDWRELKDTTKWLQGWQ